MKILIVEDDHLQVEFLRGELEEAFAHISGGAEIQVITTESEFRSRFQEISQSRPDAIVMDIMVRWADPSPNLKEPPEDVLREGFYTAGLRCERMLAGNQETRNIPVILYTVLEPGDLSSDILQLSPNAIILPKGPEVAPLIRLIRSAIDERPDGS